MLEPPQIPLTRILVNMPRMMVNPIKRFNRYLGEYGRDFILSVGGSRRTHFTINADVIQHVLQKNHKNYHKSAIQTDELARYLGRGLLTNNGQPWLIQRRLIQPGFHRQRLAALVSEMQAMIDAACEKLDQTAAANGSIHLQEIIRDLVFRVITRSASSPLAAAPGYVSVTTSLCWRCNSSWLACCATMISSCPPTLIR